MRSRAWLAALAVVAGCGGDGGASNPPPDVDTLPPPPAAYVGGHSSSIAVSDDGRTVYVVNADADSVSVINTASSTLLTEIPLAATPAPAPDGRYTPGVMPRALALSPDQASLYVTGQRAGTLIELDLATRAVKRMVSVGSEPIGVVVTADGKTIYVACSQDAEVVAVSAASFQVAARIPVAAVPWALAWSPVRNLLLVSHLLGAGVTPIDPNDNTAGAIWTLPAVAPRGDRTLAHGEVRGVYDIASRPGNDELWIPHLLLGTDTAQPALDFQSTVFPAVSIFHAAQGRYQSTLSIDADAPGVDGAFGDVVSGPHALAFTTDGAYALLVDSNSEDVMAIDAATGVEATLLRPLPGHLPEGIAVSSDTLHVYIDERNTGDVAVIRLDRSSGKLAMQVEGTLPRLARDPMPAQLRLGQHLFYSANSDEYPVTQNHWLACASCHLEGRSDGVTWRFVQGPRDTPSNAGGMRDTGFLFRTAERTRVQDYWRTINTEQGGSFDATTHAALLDALAAYVDLAIPLPVPPRTDPAKVARGKAIFERADVGCATCHAGPRFTDSGQGNAALDLGGTVTLHDVGTCATGAWPDKTSADIAGHPRAACAFDTPSLSGVASAPPYLHDGSAATLRDALERTRGTMGDISSLGAADEDALIEYLRSL